MDKIWGIDLIVIGFTLLVLIVSVGYAQPLVIAPLDEYESLNGEVLFEFERADVLLIDDNEDFTSPDEYEVVEGLVVMLEPGVYYWKVVGVLRSEVRKLTIQSKVELKLVETDDGFSVVNVGNVRLNVDVYDGDELVEKRGVEVGESVEGGDTLSGHENLRAGKYIGEYDA
jgi:hypothetical protein